MIAPACRLHRRCSGALGSERSRSSWPRSHGPPGSIGRPQRRQATSPVATRGTHHRRSRLCGCPYLRSTVLGGIGLMIADLGFSNKPCGKGGKCSARAITRRSGSQKLDRADETALALASGRPASVQRCEVRLEWLDAALRRCRRIGLAAVDRVDVSQRPQDAVVDVHRGCIQR